MQHEFSSRIYAADAQSEPLAPKWLSLIAPETFGVAPVEQLHSHLSE